MPRSRTLFPKALLFAVLNLLVAFAAYRAAWYVPSPIVGN